MASSDRLRLNVDFVEEGVSAVAELDRDNAGLTVSGILGALPISGNAFHGVYSGSEVACFIPPEIRIPRENATSWVLPGDIGYYRIRGAACTDIPRT